VGPQEFAWCDGEYTAYDPVTNITWCYNGRRPVKIGRFFANVALAGLTLRQYPLDDGNV